VSAWFTVHVLESTSTELAPYHKQYWLKYQNMIDFLYFSRNSYVLSSVAEPHHFYAAPAPGENFDAAPAPAPTLLHSKAKFLKRT
jgi:hypothetical protein